MTDSIISQLRQRAEKIEARYQQRIAICEQCPEIRLLLDMKQCGRCGCVLSAKARLPASTCPLGKWDLFHVYSQYGVERQNGMTLTFTKDEAEAYIAKLNSNVEYTIIPAVEQ